MIRPSKALEFAKTLTGQWPHARPPNEAQWLSSLAAVLAQYPLGLVEECCDPRRGLSRIREFPPTVAVLVEWCDEQLRFYQLMAAYQSPPKPSLAPKYSDHHLAIASRALRKLSDWLKSEPRGEPPTWAEAAREIGPPA